MVIRLSSDLRHGAGWEPSSGGVCQCGRDAGSDVQSGGGGESYGSGDAGRGQGDGARNVRPVLDLHVLFLVELVGDLAGYLYLVRGRVIPRNYGPDELAEALSG